MNHGTGGPCLSCPRRRLGALFLKNRFGPNSESEVRLRNAMMRKSSSSEVESIACRRKTRSWYHLPPTVSSSKGGFLASGFSVKSTFFQNDEFGYNVLSGFVEIEKSS